MKYRSFGARTGIQASELVLGTGLLGQAAGYGPDPATVRAILDAYLRAGGNILDLSDAYQGGESERVVGELVQPVRDDVVLVSKYSRSASATPGRAAVGSGRKVMMQSVDASLRRLRTDRIDVYLLHVDDGATPIDELARGFDDLVRAGKIVHGGLSNTPAWRAAALAATAGARGDSPIAAVQLEYNLFERTSDRELLPMARAFGLAVMGYSPLAAGLLTAKYRAGERGRATELARSVSHTDTERNTAILDQVVAIAAELAVRPGQIALAWALAQGVFPIIGARTPDQLAESLAAAQLRLSADQLARLEDVSRTPAGYTPTSCYRS